METVVPVEHCQLDVGAVRVRDGVGLLPIDTRVERVVAHC